MKQVSEISIVRGFVNGRLTNNRFSPIEIPQNYPIWNINYTANREFQEDAAVQALSGYKRAGLSGQRVSVSVSLRAGTPTEYERLRKILSSLSSQVMRKIYDFDAASVDIGAMQIVIDDADGIGAEVGYPLTSHPFTTDGALTNCYVRNVTRLQTRLVSAYSGVAKRLTLTGQAITSWAAGDTYEIVLLASQPTVVGVGLKAGLTAADTTYGAAQESWANGIIWCNLPNAAFQLDREFTIGTQIVTLNFESVERFNGVPEDIVITNI